jgi:hypothetical protein
VKQDRLRRAREFTGVVLKDLWRYHRRLRANDSSYLAICNRSESLAASPDGTGFRCEWQWTSDLHAAKVLPHLGLALMRRALGQHPIELEAVAPRGDGAPDVSFIIGHRGEARIPHLLATLQSIAGQRDTSVECIVVEQDSVARLPGRLPSWVTHIHTPLPRIDLPYCRAWAFNVGARRARAPMLVLHDNDLLVPTDYACSIVSRALQGYEMINLKRFLFYLGEEQTEAALAGRRSLDAQPPVAILQNSQGGGSIAITREAYERIGGFDESFVGWGGEDNEFWERGQALKVWPFAHLPLVHLWHAAQPGKHQEDNQTLSYYRARALIPVETRIAQLRVRQNGDMSGPASPMQATSTP